MCPKCTTFWKPNSKRYFQANVRTENLSLFMHKGDAAGFRQILAPGPSLHKSLPVFMSECRASWMMKPRGVAVIGSQCQKAPAFVRDGGHMGRGRAAHPEAAVRPPRFAVHLCQLWWTQQDCQWWSGNAQRRSLRFIICTKFRQESGSFIPPNQLTAPLPVRIGAARARFLLEKVTGWGPAFCPSQPPSSAAESLGPRLFQPHVCSSH